MRPRSRGGVQLDNTYGLGVLSERWSCAHSIWLTDNDIELMADHQATAVLNPESNSRIGTGVARAPLMHRHGVKFAGPPHDLGRSAAIKTGLMIKLHR